MSPIRVWDGYQWRQPQFWTGSSWRRQQDYVPYDPGVPATPPTYTPIGNYGFDDGTVQGWSGSGYDNAGEPYNNGGVCRQDITQSGLMSSGYLSSGNFSSYNVGAGVGYKGHLAMQIIRRSGSLPNTMDYEVSCGDSSTGTITRPEGNSGWFEVTTPVVYTPSDYQSFAIVINYDAGSLDGNSLYSVEVDWARVEDAAGNILHYMSDPGDPGIPPTPEVPAWPYWWDGSQWRG